MNQNIRKIVLFLGIGVVLVFAYIFISGGEEEAALVSSSPEGVVTETSAPLASSGVAGDFLTILLNIRGLSLDDSIFDDPAFKQLRDSTIVLVPDGNEGRPNPFAPIGSDAVATPLLAPEPTFQ